MTKDKDFEKMDEIKMYYIQDNSTVVVRYRIKRGWWIFKKDKWEDLVDLSGFPIGFNSTGDATDWLKEKGVNLPR